MKIFVEGNYSYIDIFNISFCEIFLIIEYFVGNVFGNICSSFI